jgi:CRISPR-associated protein Cas2
MWMLVMFDLPVTEKPQRKAATNFRNLLLGQGFGMAQFSVYYRLLSGLDAAKALEAKIKAALPEEGKVNILTITDKQYERMQSYTGTTYIPTKKQEQLQLF